MSQVQQLQLANRNQHSYANAVVLTLLWAASSSQNGIWIVNQGLRKFLQWLSTQSKPQPLWQTLAWQTLTKSWSQLLRQHDPASFLHYLHPMIFAASEGVWQAPVPNQAASMPDSCQVSHSGHARPIHLPAAPHPDDPCTLQSLVQNWHCQTQVHGLSTLSPLLALRIHRFDDKGDKINSHIHGPWKVTIPWFTDSSLTTLQVPYEVHAIIPFWVMRIARPSLRGPA